MKATYARGCFFVSISPYAGAPPPLPLWPDGAPGVLDSSSSDKDRHGLGLKDNLPYAPSASVGDRPIVLAKGAGVCAVK
jgi:hypothetical protein